MSKLTVGQTLWYVPYSDRQQSMEVRVKRVGRKWAEIERASLRLNWKIAIDTLCVEISGYGRVAQCYLSREEYERKMSTARSWREFCRRVSGRYNIPDGLTEEKIAEASAILGI